MMKRKSVRGKKRNFDKEESKREVEVKKDIKK